MTARALSISAIPRKLAAMRGALAKAEKPEQVLNISAALSALEELMRKAGLGEMENMRPVRELLLDARCELGAMLRKMLRGHGPGRGKDGRGAPSFSAEIKRLGLAETTAKECQRASCLPPDERRRVYAEAKDFGSMPTLQALIREARPYWYREARKEMHRAIARAASKSQVPGKLGPFCVVYADPPWGFETYSELGKERSAERHYPTLTDYHLAHFEIEGRSIRDFLSADAALFLWATSSNIDRALKVMEAWGFTFRTSAAWVKTKADGRSPIAGTGYIFRNCHELLLYGTRCDMPGPQHLPLSVFHLPRRAHSAKPPEIRAAIEQMYPDFDESTRLELFSRDGAAPGWTHYGFEARSRIADSGAREGTEKPTEGTDTLH